MADTTAAPPPLPPASGGLSRRIAGRPLRRWLTDIVLLALGVISLAFEPFSIAVHSIIGLAFVGLVGPHLWGRRRWIAATVAGLRERRRMGLRRRWSLTQAAVLLALALIVTASGLWDWLGVPTRIRYHAISGVLLIGVTGWHAWTRRRSLVRRRPRAGADQRGRRRSG